MDSNNDNRKATLQLGTQPVGRLLYQYALPAIVAMLASSLYNMVDSIFIGQGVGPMAISGLAITFPFMNLTGAFGAAIGIGASTLLSLRLGQRDYESASRILGNTLTLNLLTGVGLSLVCLWWLNDILHFFGASALTLPYAREYMVVILLGNVITQTYLGMNAVLRAASKPRQAMYATLFTVVLNTLLDPLFIYPWGLGMGIQGAAWATVLSQALALVWQLRVLSRPTELLHLQRHTLRPRLSLVRNILEIGISPFSINACACLVVIICNNQLMRYGGEYAVGAFGIANKIAFVFLMVVFGLNQGMQPIVGYNYGAGQHTRVRHALRLTALSATAVTSTGWLIAQVSPWLCVRLFTADAHLINVSISALRILMLVYPVVGFQMCTTYFFQCIGRVRTSIFLSLSRQLIFLIPLMLLLPMRWQLDGVWAALPLSDSIAATVTALALWRYLKEQQHPTETIKP